VEYLHTELPLHHGFSLLKCQPGRSEFNLRKELNYSLHHSFKNTRLSLTFHCFRVYNLWICLHLP